MLPDWGRRVISCIFVVIVRAKFHSSKWILKCCRSMFTVIHSSLMQFHTNRLISIHTAVWQHYGRNAFAPDWHANTMNQRQLLWLALISADVCRRAKYHKSSHTWRVGADATMTHYWSGPICTIQESNVLSGRVHVMSSDVLRDFHRASS